MTVKLKPEFDKYKAFIFDLDGVIYTGNTPIDSAIDAIKKLIAAKKKVFFLTNNSSVFIDRSVEKLNSFGIEIGNDFFLNSALATAIYLKSHNYPKEIYLVGEEAFKSILEEHGFEVLNTSEGAKTVVVGINFSFDYDKLKHALFAIANGAEFIASNTDAVMPTESGFLPGGGTMVAAIQAGSAKKPKVIGKPNKSIFKIALDLLKVKNNEVVCVGDRLETDILGGNNSNIDTVLVLTGVTTEQKLKESEIRPKYVLKSIAEMFSANLST